MSAQENTPGIMQPSLLKDCTYSFSKVLVWIAFHSYFRLHVFGSERVPPKGPLLVASNHVSSLDPMVIGVALRRQIFLLARDSLLGGFAGWMLQVHGARPIRRGSVSGSDGQRPIDRLSTTRGGRRSARVSIAEQTQ